jgi:hypothetical protein
LPSSRVGSVRRARPTNWSGPCFPTDSLRDQWGQRDAPNRSTPAVGPSPWDGRWR